MNDKNLGAGGIIILGALLLLGTFYIPEQLRISDQAEAATLRCRAADDTDACMPGIEKWAKECYHKAFYDRAQTNAFSGPPITRKGLALYDHCVRHGPDSVLELLREKGEKRRKLEREREKELEGLHLP